jgi:hypothetical protein
VGDRVPEPAVPFTVPFTVPVEPVEGERGLRGLRELAELAQLAELAELKARERLRNLGGWPTLLVVGVLLSARRGRRRKKERSDG